MSAPYYRAMGNPFRPRTLHDATARRTEPIAVVEAFLGSLALRNDCGQHQRRQRDGAHKCLQQEQ